MSGERAGEAARRGNLYRLLGLLLRDPVDRELWDYLAENFPELVGGEPEGLEAEARLRALRVDFTELFVLNLQPYESAFVDETGLLNTRATDLVVDFYRAAGFRPAGPSSVAAYDHAGVELEFLGQLAREEEAAWREGDAARARERLGRRAEFLDRHLLRWFPAFTAAAEDAAETAFYRRLLRFAREVALEDRNLIARTLGAR